MPTDQNELREDCGRPEAWRGGGMMKRPAEANARAEELAMRRAAKAQALATGSPCPECGFRHAPAASPTAEAGDYKAKYEALVERYARNKAACCRARGRLMQDAVASALRAEPSIEKDQEDK